MISLPSHGIRGSMHCNAQQPHDALQVLDLMHREGAYIPSSLIAPLLDLCTTKHDPARGQRAHQLLLSLELDSAASHAGNLIRFFASTGRLLEASLAFCKVAVPSLHTWHAVISAHVSLGRSFEALFLYSKMHGDGVEPNNSLYMSGLRACANAGALETGKVLHHQILESELEQDVGVGNTLIHMYSMCGSLKEAHRVFDGLMGCDVVSWGAMIGGCAHQGDNCLALELFERMQHRNTKPNKVVLLCTLVACGNHGTVSSGQLIHDEIFRMGLECDKELGSSLIDMYVKCGSLEEAHKVFKSLKAKNVVSWCALIVGVAKHGNNQLAFELFEKMQEEGIKPNEYAYSCMLNACGCKGDLEKGKSMHAEVVKVGLEADEVIGNTLVGMYAQCGELEMSHRVFTKVSNRSLVAWSIMISKKVEHGDSFCALELYVEMQQCGTKPNMAIFSSILKACANLGATQQGMLIHHKMLKSGLEFDEVAGSTLVDMYARCGCMEEAHKALVVLPKRNSVSWGVLIAGYSRQANIKMAGQCLKDMTEQGIEPNAMIYTSILAACNHVGNAEDSQTFFKSMTEDHRIVPNMHHVHCLINLLGCIGQLTEGIKILQSLPFSHDMSGWMSLLTACRIHGNVGLGRQCFNHIIGQDRTSAAAYALMSGIYADAQLWEAFHQIQELKRSGVYTKKAKKGRRIERKS